MRAPWLPFICCHCDLDPGRTVGWSERECVSLNLHPLKKTECVSVNVYRAGGAHPRGGGGRGETGGGGQVAACPGRCVCVCVWQRECELAGQAGCGAPGQTGRCSGRWGCSCNEVLLAAIRRPKSLWPQLLQRAPPGIKIMGQQRSWPQENDAQPQGAPYTWTNVCV